MASNNGYTPIKYYEFQRLLNRTLVDKAGTNHAEYFRNLGRKMKKSPVSIRNCFQESRQMVSDEMLTKVTDILELEVKIEWVSGQRYYCIKNKQSKRKTKSE